MRPCERKTGGVGFMEGSIHAPPEPRPQEHSIAPRAGTRAGTDPAEKCLSRVLLAFFPSHVGAARRHQARGYIRTSAIGRGSYPTGSPRPKELVSALVSMGFSRRSHRGHLQAPWGARSDPGSNRLMNELSSFLRTGEKGPGVRALLERIRKEGRW